MIEMSNDNKSADNQNIFLNRYWTISILVFIVSWGVSIFLWLQVDIDKSILFELNNSNFSPGNPIQYS